MNDMEANSLLRGLIFVIQKTKSDLMEGLGAGPDPQGQVMSSLLEDMQPILFGDKAILPRLLEWQKRCESTGVIAGSDMFNLFKFIDMSEARAALGLLGVYGYTAPEEADIQWFAQQWPYLTA